MVTGDGPQPIVGVTVSTELTKVVEVVFADDSVALAWTLPTRHRARSRPQTLSPRAAVACRGAPATSQDLMQRLGIHSRYGFLDCASAALRRSHSMGDRPHGASWYSCGSLNHREATPESCTVCEVHRRHLLSVEAPRCRHGEACPFCHMPHPLRGA